MKNQIKKIFKKGPISLNSKINKNKSNQASMESMVYIGNLILFNKILSRYLSLRITCFNKRKINSLIVKKVISFAGKNCPGEKEFLLQPKYHRIANNGINDIKLVRHNKIFLTLIINLHFYFPIFTSHLCLFLD